MALKSEVAALQELQAMELFRALSNPATRNKLARLNACRKRLLRDAPHEARPTTRPPKRAGEMARAVLAVLAKAGEPMKVTEVHSAVENLLQRPVNRRSLKACLSEGSLAAKPKLRRTKRGCYRLADPT